MAADGGLILRSCPTARLVLPAQYPPSTGWGVGIHPFGSVTSHDSWIPAFAGMTESQARLDLIPRLWPSPPSVIPAKAGIQFPGCVRSHDSWIPAFAGMTAWRRPIPQCPEACTDTRVLRRRDTLRPVRLHPHRPTRFLPDLPVRMRNRAHPVFAYFPGSWGRCPQTPEVYRFTPIA